MFSLNTNSWKVQLEPEAWDSVGPHRVSVNSFGYGGSNAHIILEDAVGYLSSRGLKGLHRNTAPILPIEPLTIINGTGEAFHVVGNGDSDSQMLLRTRIFTLSGFDETSCMKQIQQLHEYLTQKGEVDDYFMNDLAFTLNERRTKHSWRAAVIGDSAECVVEALQKNVKLKRTARKPSVGFVFTGQGAQWCGMGKELYSTYPVFRQTINQIDAYLVDTGASYSLVGMSQINPLSYCS